MTGESGMNGKGLPPGGLSGLPEDPLELGPSEEVLKRIESRDRTGRFMPRSESPALKRIAWLAALAAVFAAAFVWRWHYASQTRIYTYDSYYYMVLGSSLRHGFHYTFAGHPHFKFMPLYPVSIAFFNLFTSNLEWVGKFTNLLFTSSCVFPIYAIGSTLFHRRVGLAAAALFAFEPITTVWASVPMSEGLFALLVCTAICCAVRWWKKEKTLWIYLGAAAAGLAVVTRWEGFFLLAFLGLFGLYHCVRGRMKWRHLALAGALALLPFAAYTLRNIIVFGTPLKSAYLQEYSSYDRELEVLKPWGRLGRYLLFGGINPLGQTRRLYHYGYLAFGYGGLIFGLFIRRFRAATAFVLAWLLFMGPTHFVWYFVSARFLFAAAPALCLGAGFLLGFPWIENGRESERRGAIALVYALAVLIIAALAFTSVPIVDDSFFRDIGRIEDDDGGLATKQAMLWLKENAQGAKVASRSGPFTTFYLGRDVLFLGDWVFEPPDVSLDDLVEDARSKGVRYVVLHAWCPEPSQAIAQAGLEPSVLDQLRLVKVFSVPPDKEGLLEVYSFVFEVPGAGGAPP
jgi:hypothetical protein